MSVPLSIRPLGTSTSPLPVTVETDNISLEGLSIAVKIKIRVKDRYLSFREVENAIRLLQYLLVKGKTLELGINILPKGGSIKGIGRVMWNDKGLTNEYYYLKAGLSIKGMEREQKGKWLEFLKTGYTILLCLGNRGGQRKEIASKFNSGR